MRRLASILSLMVLTGCSRELNRPVEPPVETAIEGSTASNAVMKSAPFVDEAKAIEIARLVMTTNQTWPATNVTYQVTSNATGWRVLAIPDSLVFGSHRWIELDKTGNVIRYTPGF